MDTSYYPTLKGVNANLLRSVSETLLLCVALDGHLRKQDIVDLEMSQLSHFQSLRC